MGKVNLSRVILGGIVAGIVLNISQFVLHTYVLKEAEVEAMKRLNITMQETGTTMAVWVLWAFAWGIGAIWLYAAIRPRYGPGPGTAARAGLAAWFFCCLLSVVAMVNLGIFPFNAVGFIWELAHSLLATIIGAAIYKEAQG
jgi:hypothetical protein